MTTDRRSLRRLLTGAPGREGFLYHDGFNQPVHQAAPGLLGLLEGRQAMAQWKPAIVRWMDEAGHFFDHILDELGGEASFQAVRDEIEAIRGLDAPMAAKSQFLFHFLSVVTRDPERRLAVGPRRGTGAFGPATDLTGTGAPLALSLNGTWTAYYRQAPGKYKEVPMDLPVNWELVPGITSYSGTMRFGTTIDLPEEWEERRVFLTFAGVDYFCDLWVNGHHVGGHEGYFCPFEFDISPYARFGETNVIRLAVTSPIEPAGDGIDVTSGWRDFRPTSSFPNRKTLVKGTLGHHDAKRGGAWSSVTSQDGNTGGVWNDVELCVRNPVHFEPSKTRVTTLSLASASTRPAVGDWTATVLAHLSLRNATERRVDATVRFRVEPANFEGEGHEFAADVVLSPGATSFTHERKLSPVRVWQPWDQGTPHLYRVRVTLEHDGLVLDETEVETGFRTLGVTPIGESTGVDGAFVVNGTPVFVRGTNLLPTYWLSEYTDEAIARDLQLLRDAGFNAVLLHNLVPPRRFYRQANRHGVMVVQMLPLQWTYEQSAELVARATRQVDEMAAFLYNEPAVVSYEAHNEPDMRTAENLDNRLFDFDLHAAFRRADPYRWATTYSSGNHAYPGQFYPLRDDNSFRTLPARFEEDQFDGRRISRHRNMPTEFGIQAMPHRELFEELVSEPRVHSVLARLRRDPKWIAGGGESWNTTRRTMEAAKEVLGGGSWEKALETLDWRHLRKLGELWGEIARLKRAGAGATDREVLSRKLALLLSDTLHYGAFKGEDFWFGAWPPSSTLDDFVRASQNRQYRLHKDAIEMYLNAGVTGPIVGFFSFMFRDADWQAPTWGVVDAAWVPKKAYRAYLESNHPVRVTLPQALRAPVKLPGDPWFGVPGAIDGGHHGNTEKPWADAELIVANDTSETLRTAEVALWLEDADGVTVPLVDRAGRAREAYLLRVDLQPRTGFSYFERVSGARAADPPDSWIVGPTTPGGTYYLKARISTAQGEVLSTNSYELLVPDLEFEDLQYLSAGQIGALLDGVAGGRGFHYWHQGHVAHLAPPGVRGLVTGFRQAQDRGIDVYEVVQGEHLFHHIVCELQGVDGADSLLEAIWTIRSEVISPSAKAGVLVRYLQLFVRRAEEILAAGSYASDEQAGAPRTRPRPRSTYEPTHRTPPARPVGSDLVSLPPTPRKVRL